MRRHTTPIAAREMAWSSPIWLEWPCCRPVPVEQGRIGTLLVVFVLLVPSLARAWGPDTSLADASATFWMEWEDESAMSMAACGDVNGDGRGDLLIGATGNDEGGEDAGQVYLLMENMVCVDQDGDGYGDPGDSSCPAGQQTDCDDTEASINPGAEENCYDLIDNDCDGLIDRDDDDCPESDDDDSAGDDDDDSSAGDDDTGVGDDDDTAAGDDDTDAGDDDDCHCSAPGNGGAGARPQTTTTLAWLAALTLLVLSRRRR